MLFCVYARASWSDAMHAHKYVIGADESGVTQFSECEAVVHKTMHAELYKRRYLPLVAPAIGVVQEPWIERWILVRKSLFLRCRQIILLCLPLEVMVVLIEGSNCAVKEVR